MSSLVKTINEKQDLLRLVKSYELEINVIFDCGSRDALDGIELYQSFNSKELHVFECNPPSVAVCRDNLMSYLGGEFENSNWFLNDFALSDIVGTRSFHAIDTNRSESVHIDGNPGASSLLLASKDYTREKYVQIEIEVPSGTLDVYCQQANKPDLLWMDLQGAELLVLRGACGILSSVKCIHVEIGFRAMYEGQPLFWEVDRFLKSHDFELVNIDIGRWPRFLGLYRFFQFGPWIGNAIYVNKKCLI